MFGRDWRADAERRDFTINALSASADGRVYDYVGGVADIAARRVRFIGEPAMRIAEDYLRILRFFRFHAWYGRGAPDPAGLQACIRARGGLETLSRERVRMELLKLLLAPRAAPVLAAMAEAGLLGAVLGGVPHLSSFENMVKVEAVIGLAADAVRRLGALGVMVVEDAERLGQRLRLSNADAERLAALERWWRVSAECGDQPAHALLYRLGPQSFADRVLVAWSRSPAGAADRTWHALASLPQRWTAPELSAQGRRLHPSWIGARPGFGGHLARGGRSLDRGGLSGRARRARRYRRPGGARDCGERLRILRLYDDIRSRSDRNRRRLPVANSRTRGRTRAMIPCRC